MLQLILVHFLSEPLHTLLLINLFILLIVLFLLRRVHYLSLSITEQLLFEFFQLP